MTSNNRWKFGNDGGESICFSFKLYFLFFASSSRENKQIKTTEK